VAPTPAATTPVAPTTAPRQPYAPLNSITSGQIEQLPTQNFCDIFFTQPGATSSTFAPGASRPILRGLSDSRVRVQESGVGTADVSDLSQDHAVPIDPLAIQNIEIYRGPAALRYGSQAVGGIVEAINNRIPTMAPFGGAAERRPASAASTTAGKARCCSMPARATRSTPMFPDAGPAIVDRAIRTVSARSSAGGERPAAELVAQRRAHRPAARGCSTAVTPAPRSPASSPTIRSRHRSLRAPVASARADQGHQQG
jgi:hypothetical protein